MTLEIFQALSATAICVLVELFLQANYILVLVSPLYRQVVEGTSPSAAEASRNAAQIYRRMQADYRQSPSGTRRFVAVVTPGNSRNDVPEWLRKVAPIYKWPDEYLNLFYYMVRPAEVITSYIQRKEREVTAHT